MTLPKIEAVPVYGPGSTYFSCPSCGRLPRREQYDATLWIVAPDGDVTGSTCKRHGEETLREFLKIGEAWRLAPIFSERVPRGRYETRNEDETGESQ